MDTSGNWSTLNFGGTEIKLVNTGTGTIDDNGTIILGFYNV